MVRATTDEVNRNIRGAELSKPRGNGRVSFLAERVTGADVQGQCHRVIAHVWRVVTRRAEAGNGASQRRIIVDQRTLRISYRASNHSVALPLDIGTSHSLSQETDPAIAAGLAQLSSPMFRFTSSVVARTHLNTTQPSPNLPRRSTLRIQARRLSAASAAISIGVKGRFCEAWQRAHPTFIMARPGT